MFINNARGRLILFSVAALTILLSLIFLYEKNTTHDGKENKSSFDGDMTDSGKRSFASIKGFALSELNNNGTGYKVIAQKAYIRNKKVGFLRLAFQKIAEIEGITVNIYEDNHEVATISSDRSTLFLGTRELLFEGNVKLSASDGRTLNTNTLFLDYKKKILKTDDEFMFTSSDGLQKMGEGYTTDMKLDSIQLGTKTIELLRKRDI